MHYYETCSVVEYPNIISIWYSTTLLSSSLSSHLAHKKTTLRFIGSVPRHAIFQATSDCKNVNIGNQSWSDNKSKYNDDNDGYKLN